MIRVLENLGVKHINISGNGEEAVKECQEKLFDLILMDCQMPLMDGYEATKQIRLESLNQQTPIIALTANAFKGTADECFKVGMNAFLTKPVNKQALKKAILERKTPEFMYFI